MKKTQRCIFPVAFTLDGEERIEWPDPDCPRHGLREGIRGTHIWKYRRCKRHGLANCRLKNSRGYPVCWAADYEDAREVQQRLYREAVAA